MRQYLIKRLIMAIPTALGVVSLVFLLQPLIPGDPVDFLLGEQVTLADREELRRAYDLDKPLIQQYLIFLSKLTRGDMRRSIITGQPVAKMIVSRYPATLELALASMLVAVALAVPLGVISALKRNTLVDKLSMTGALLGISIPNFWLGPMLIIVFAIKLNLLPVSGRGGPQHLILPALTLGTAMAAILTRMTRSSMLDVINEDYIRTARAKGLKESATIFKHALRNALVPVITIAGMQFGALLAGAVITETIFSWPGIGRLLITAVNSRDFPLLQGCTIAIGLSFVLVNIITDILYVVVDPRIRLK